MCRFALLSAVLILAGPAWSDDDGKASKRRAGPRVVHLDLDGAEVTATVTRPSVKWIGERPRPQFNPLIRLRTEFVAEMRDSIDEVR